MFEWNTDPFQLVQQTLIIEGEITVCVGQFCFAKP